MKKHQHKTKKICRKKHPAEPEIDFEFQKQVNALATQFKDDQLKAILRRGYTNVQKYGPEAILKAINDSWSVAAAAASGGINNDSFVEIEREVASKYLDLIPRPEDLEVVACLAGGTVHSHKETAKRNAIFLIESSERLEDYDVDTLAEMKRAYEKDRDDDVADLADLQDRNRRPAPMYPESRVNDNTTLRREAPISPWSRVAELLTEVADEERHKESPLKCCVEAVRHLSRDLTYDNRTDAKESIRKAIKHLEE